jgi:hypothetical protein
VACLATPLDWAYGSPLQISSSFACDLSRWGFDLCRRSAQVLPDGPSEHHFWDTANKVLLSSDGVLEAVDFGITHHNLSDGGRLMDSMAKALCESGTAGQLDFFGGRMTGVVGISYLLHRTGHHKLERAFPVYGSGDSAYGVGYRFAHR